jgi:hypothetical protein
MSDLIYNHLHWLHFRRKRGLRGGAELQSDVRVCGDNGVAVVATGWLGTASAPLPATLRAAKSSSITRRGTAHWSW